MNMKSKIKYYLSLPFALVSIIDDMTFGNIKSSLLSIDEIIDKASIYSDLKQILRPTQYILYTYLYINILFLNEYDYKYIYKLLLFLVFLLIFIVKISNPGVIEKDFSSKLQVFSRNKYKNIVKCEECNQITKIIRSVHCYKCNNCISKFELHSFWLNTDIGSGNCAFYSLFLMFFYVFSLFSCVFSVFNWFFIENDGFIVYFLVFSNFYCIFKYFSFTKRFLYGNLSNITYYERLNYRRLYYLWSDLNKNFYNPFNRNSKYKNIYEMIISAIDIDCSDKFDLEDKESTVNTVNSTNNYMEIPNNDVILEVKSKSTVQPENISNISHSHSHCIDNFYNVYYIPYSSSSSTQISYVNWRRLRLFSILDIKNCPLIKLIPENIISSFN